MAIASFFAMSGYGLVKSYLNNNGYIKTFFARSIIKLYVPYILALILFCIYYLAAHISIMEILSDDLCSLVPTSWFIFVLSLFYTFFYIVFKFLPYKNNLTKVLILCFLIFIYYFLAEYFDVSSWRFLRSPAFCVGLFFALYDEDIRKHLKKLHCFMLLFLCLIGSRFVVIIQPVFDGTALFLLMYLIRYLPDNRIIKFLSSVSFELYIFQYIPIYILVYHVNNISSFLVIFLVIMFDILLAYIMHIVIMSIISYINNHCHLCIKKQ